MSHEANSETWESYRQIKNKVRIIGIGNIPRHIAVNIPACCSKFQKKIIHEEVPKFIGIFVLPVSNKRLLDTVLNPIFSRFFPSPLRNLREKISKIIVERE